MSSAIAVLAALAAGPGDDGLWRPAGAQAIEYDPEIVIEAFGRASLAGGTLDRDVPVDYGDVFGSGAGLGAEAAFLFRTDGPWRAGPYASLLFENFDGRRDTDPFGDSLEPEDLELVTLLGGFKGRMLFGNGFYWDVHAALGLSHNQKTEGVLIVGGVRTDVDVFDESTHLAFDFGARMGFARRRLNFELGFGVRIQGSPEEADIDFSSDPLTTGAIELAIGVAF